MDNSKGLLSRILELNQFFDKIEKAGPTMKKSTSFSEEFRIKGNTLYNRGKHDRAEHQQLISLYTASISFAPKDSEHLAKGFANRSAVLMHMRHYKEALIDIDRALLVSKSNNLKFKLKSRRDRCLKFIDKSNVKLPYVLPDVKPSVKLPNASEAVDVEYSEKFGRHLVATRDIKPGEVIVAEQSFVCFPEYDGLHFICSHCLRFAWNGIPCDTCVLAVFCSEECQNEAWEEYHDVECSIIRTMFLITEENRTNKAMVTVRLFIKAVKSEGFVDIIDEVETSSEQKDKIQKLLSNGILDSNKFKSYYNLLFQIENKKTKEDRHSDFNSALFIVTLLYRHTTIIPVSKLKDSDPADHELVMASIKIIMRLNDILGFNNFLHQAPLCDCTDINECKKLCDIDRGTILAATSSLINHSCCPNVSKIFLPEKKIVMFTTAPVKKGQQLFVSYGPAFSHKKEERQKLLKEQFNFLCSCPACEEDWPQHIEIELCKNPVETAPIFNKLEKDFKNHFLDEKLSYNDIITGFIDHRLEKSLLEKATVISDWIYKYFEYRTAYNHCLQLALLIEKLFLKFYGENCVIPKNC